VTRFEVRGRRITLAAALLWSPSVRAYFDRENLDALRVPDQEALV
jgi:hypothetical protein